MFNLNRSNFLKIILILPLFYIAGVIRAQSPDYEFCIKHINSNVAITVGNDGIIKKTVDGGITWQQVASGTTENLYCVDFINDFTGLAVGSNGMVLYTNNSGDTWEIKNSNTTENLFGIEMTTSGSIACGSNGTIIQSSDQGNTWNILNSPSANNLNYISFLDENNGYIVGDNGTYAYSTDGGLTWQVKDLNKTEGLYSISMTNETSGTIVGENGIILNTTDGWDTYTSPVTNYTMGFNDVKFIDNNTAVAVGEVGTIIRTEDAGATWNIVYSCHATITEIKSVSLNGSNGIAVGKDNSRYYTNDGGMTWTTEKSNSPRNTSELKKKDVVLSQNYPNPFNPSTKINYVLPFSSQVRLSVYDMSGREVANLVNTQQNAGSYSIEFNASNLASGVYIYKISANSGNQNFVKVNKMILTK